MGGKSYSKTKIKIQRWDNSPARQGECPISESNPHAGIKHSTVATPQVNNLVHKIRGERCFCCADRLACSLAFGSRFGSRCACMVAMWAPCGLPLEAGPPSPSTLLNRCLVLL